MDMQSLMYYSLLSGGKGSSDMLPLILMQLESKKGSSENGNVGLSNEILDAIVYQPMGRRILSNFATKILKMDTAQRAKLMASLALDRLSTQQKGKFGETLLLASRTGMLELLGEPLAVAGIDENKGNSDVGGLTLGNARKSVIEQAKELEIEEGEGTGKKEKQKQKKKGFAPVF